MGEPVKATISIGDTVVTFEGPQEFVDMQVKRYMHGSVPSDNDGRKQTAAESSSVKENTGITERDLVAAKRPKGHSETVAVLAFALSEAGAPEFTEDDIRRAYIRAGVRQPKVVGQAIRDAKNVFDFIESGSKRGTYRLSNHGDRTVRFDLPRRGKEE